MIIKHLPCIFSVNTRQQRSHNESRDFFVGFRSFYSLHPSEISMLGVGKAAPAQFILRGKTNLRRISAAGQKAGFAAYPSRWASIWWDVIGGQCIFFANTRHVGASFISFAPTFFKKSERTHSAAPPFQAANAPLVCGLMRWGLWIGASFSST